MFQTYRNVKEDVFIIIQDTIKTGRSQMLKYLLPIITISTSLLSGPLHDACKSGDLDAFRQSLTMQNIHERENGFSPIMLALQHGHHNIIHELVLFVHDDRQIIRLMTDLEEQRKIMQDLKLPAITWRNFCRS